MFPLEPQVKIYPAPAKASSSTVLVCFSQQRFYPMTEPRLNHPRPKDRDLVSSKRVSKLPDSNLYFSLSRITIRRQRLN